MARYSTTLFTTSPAHVVLDRLADFASVAQWDPGITDAALLAGEPGEVGARYHVAATFGPRHIPLVYVITERVEVGPVSPGRVVLEADGGSFTSHDTITVNPVEGGCRVQYEAILTLKGVGRVLDWPLGVTFQVIGRRAEQGLRAELARLALAPDGKPE
jgi:hypothetical protein